MSKNVEADKESPRIGRPQRASSVYDVLAEASAANPGLHALTYLRTADSSSAVRLTYREFLARLDGVACLLKRSGVGRFDVVSILSPNVPNALIAFFAAETVGIVNPINYLLRSADIEGMMRAVGSKVLIAAGPEDADIWSKIQDIRTRVPSLAHVFTTGEPGEAAMSLQEAVAVHPADVLSPADLPGPNDVAAYFHTGGTTGLPKLAIHLHRNQVHSSGALADSWHFNAETRLINGLPLFHVAGSLLLALGPLSRGGEVILPTSTAYRNRRVILDYWRLVEQLGVTICGGIPTTLAALLEVPLAGCNISSLKFCLTGGSHMPAAVAQSFKQKFSVDVRQLYGMTETAGLIAAAHHSSSPDPFSIGEVIAGADVEARELKGDGELGDVLPPGELGMLVTRGPHVFPGYFGMTSLPGPFTDDGWFITGDIGYMRSDGRLTVTGRAKDVIIRSGHNIDPAVVEEVAVRCEGVAVAAAVGMPDAYAGEVVVVYVMLMQGHAPSAAALMAQMSAGVPEPPAKPRHVFILDDMPTTAVGKIDKAALRRDATAHAVRAALRGIPLKEETFRISVKEGSGGQLAVMVNLTNDYADISAVQAAISEELSRYSFSHEIVEA